MSTPLTINPTTMTQPNQTIPAIETWLIQTIATHVGVEPARIATDTPFDELGLDSVAAVGVSGELSDLLGKDLPGTLLFEYATVSELARHLGVEA